MQHVLGFVNKKKVRDSLTVHIRKLQFYVQKLCDYYVFREFQPTSTYLLPNSHVLFYISTTQCYVNIKAVIGNRNIDLLCKINSVRFS